jgi:hypothetical protein
MYCSVYEGRREKKNHNRWKLVFQLLQMLLSVLKSLINHLATCTVRMPTIVMRPNKSEEKMPELTRNLSLLNFLSLQSTLIIPMRLADERCFNSFVSRVPWTFVSFEQLTFSLGDMLGKHNLPEMLLAPCLNVMRSLSSSKWDLIRIVVKTVHELCNSVDSNDESRQGGGNPTKQTECKPAK